MKEKLVTLAIHTIERAMQLQNKLEKEGIPAFIKKIRHVSTGVRVRVREIDLPKALAIVEKNKNYSPLSHKKNNLILVPTDFSDYAFHAGKMAFYLAHDLSAEVVFLYVNQITDVTTFPVLLPSDKKERQEQNKQSINNKINRLMSDYQYLIDNQNIPDVVFSFETKHGIPEDEIINFCYDKQPILLVMGTRSKQTKDNDLIGSITAEVVEKSIIPVFVIPQNTHLNTIKSIKHIVYATNFDKKDLVSFEKLMYFVHNLQFKVTFIHSSTDEIIDYKQKMNDISQYFDNQYPHLILDFSLINSDKSILRDIETFAQHNLVDIIAVRHIKRGMFHRLFTTSLSKKLVYQAKFPLIIFN